MLNFECDQDELGDADDTQPPPVTQETQVAADAAPPRGRSTRVRRAVERFTPSSLVQNIKKKSKKVGAGSSRA